MTKPAQARVAPRGFNVIRLRGFLLLIMLIPLAARAVTFGSEIGVGWTYFDRAENGAWHQSPLPMEYDRQAVSINAGLLMKFDDSAYRLHIGFQYLGSTSSHAQASPSDENYRAWLAGEAPLWPPSDYYGSGKVAGMYLALSHDFGPLYLKGGLWLHEPKWEIAVPNWRCPTHGDDLCVAYQPGTQPSDREFSLRLRNYGDIEVGALIGIGRRWPQYEIEFSIWQVRKGGPYFPLYRGFAHNLSLRLHF